MKRFFSILALSALLFSFSGCSSDTPKDNVISTSSAEELSSDKEVSSAEEAEKPQKTAAELAELVLNSVEFPQTVKVTDPDQAEAKGIDLSLTEDYAVIHQMLSVDVVEIIVLRVKEGSMETVVESLQKRKESLIHDFAFYPGQVESAEATVVGSKGVFAYLICHKDAKTAEERLLEEIG